MKAKLNSEIAINVYMYICTIILAVIMYFLTTTKAELSSSNNTLNDIFNMAKDGAVIISWICVVLFLILSIRTTIKLITKQVRKRSK